MSTATGAPSGPLIRTRAPRTPGVLRTPPTPRTLRITRTSPSAGPSPASRAFLTGPTYRRLVLGGLAPDEAASLTAFLCGLPLGAAGWRPSELNRLLFLRELHRTGRLGGHSRPT